MNAVPSREKYKNCYSRNHLTPAKRKEYREYRYKLCIFLDLTKVVPTYYFLEINTYRNKEAESLEKKFVIVNKHLDEAGKVRARNMLAEETLWLPDHKHLGELLFILAAKLKYDLTKDSKNVEDRSGFLHTKEIKEMNPGGQKQGERKTYVGKSVYGTLRKLYNPKNEKDKEKIKAFLFSFLIEPIQLYHLICYIGSTDPSNEQLFWWLNISAKDIIFKDVHNSKAIPRKKLEQVLDALFHNSLMEGGNLERMFEYADRKIEDDNKIQKLIQAKPRNINEREIRSNEKLELYTPIIDVDPNKKQNLLRYEYCWITFSGRNNEMNRLLKFAEYKGENFLWWLISGKGGIGKSRLAQELCRRLKRKGWNAGFLVDFEQLDRLNQWQPYQPTLIIVDYSFGEAKRIGNFIGRLYAENNKGGCPVRMLFLNRTEKSEALNQFYSAYRAYFEVTRYNHIKQVNEKASL